MFKQTLLKATEAAAAVLKENFDKAFTISSKSGINDLVTEVDHKSEKVIIDIIKQDFPEHYILSEEAGELVQDSLIKGLYTAPISMRPSISSPMLTQQIGMPCA